MGRQDQHGTSIQTAGCSIPRRVIFLAVVAAWQTGLLVALLFETDRLRSRLLADATPGIWWNRPAYDGTFFVPWLFLAPFCWGFQFRRPALNIVSRVVDVKQPSSSVLILSAALVGLLSLTVSWTSTELPINSELPLRQIEDALPLVQDELSYQLQARALLECRWWWPGPSRAPELFHQMHVLNEGRFASRYFPGTGIWMAPWLALGHPVWGSRCAGIVTSIGMLLIGCELGCLSVGMIAGLVTALAPGMAVFNNLLLSHSPTLIGLVIFLYSFLRLMRGCGSGYALMAGCGLAFAMLCRPLTAAAVGLPFGIWFLASGVLRFRFANAHQLKQDWTRSAVALAIPLAVGLAIIGWQNRALTGNLLVTPYQRYTQVYTPRHAYGFHQGKADLNASHRQVLRSYDNWAEDLDLPLAVSNGVRRLRGSLAWGMGVIPLLMGAVFGALTSPWQSRPVQLILAAIISLHVVHLPYWLDGMLGHHYVFESGPLWILIFAIASSQLMRFEWQRRCWLFPGWWGCLVILSVMMNHIGMGPQGISRVEAGWRTFLLPTAGYRAFEKTLQEVELVKPALILVRPGEADLHSQFVRNFPPWNADVLVGMERPDLYSMQEVSALFPARTVYLYNSSQRSLTRISTPRDQPPEVNP